MKKQNQTLRQKRVASLIKEEISRIILYSVEEQKSGLISVTHVYVSKDLKMAEIYLSFYQPQTDINSLVTHLNQRAQHYRHLIGSKIRLKYIPVLSFILDSSPEEEERLDHLLNKLKKE
ncbi:MAG: ribosome-binding factor A [Candidatus Aminicenantes bacterium 4484_214]|nr:MAG: ribosome-binding factor A [Candidatus Aminicenantes bacterium 4484_214]